MSLYAICFDFPETDDPWFARLSADGAGVTGVLEYATRWPSETVAERILESYGPETRSYGVVVEVPV